MSESVPSKMAGRRETHSREVEQGRAFWWTDTLWEHSRGLLPSPVAIDDITEFGMDCWFGPTLPPTCRAVAEHARRIHSADLDLPVILAADGRLMDGGHRIAKAWLAGRTHVQAVRFATDPEPDWFEPQP